MRMHCQTINIYKSPDTSLPDTDPATMDRPNTQMAMFTLAQKVFTVKAYYQNRESSSVAMESLTRRYGIRNTTDNRTIVSRIILTFEKTGSILNRFYYNTGGSPEPQKRRIPPRAKKTEPQSDAEESPARQRQLQVMELSEDDLIVEVFSEMDAETRSVNVEEEEEQHDDEPVDGEDLVHEDDIIEMDESSLIAAAREVETAAHCSTLPDPSQDVVLAVVPDRAVRPKVFRDMLCPECGKTMPSSKMKSHLQQHHQETKSDEPPKKFKCDVCPAEFTTRSNVFTHRRKHFPHMQFVCEICAKVSTNNAIHKNHMLVSEERSSSPVLPSNSSPLPHRCILTKGHISVPIVH